MNPEKGQMASEIISSQVEEQGPDDVFQQESGSEGSTTDSRNESFENHYPKHVTSPIRPTHFHHPEYINEVNNNRVVVQHPKRTVVNIHPESGVDRTSLADAESWNTPLSNRNQGTWYSRWQDKEEEDELERIEQKKEELRRKTTEELLKLPCSMGRMLLKEQEQLEVRMQKECMDPRLASRSPGANTSIPAKPRYNSPVNSSPSRTLREARDTRMGFSIQNLSTQGDDNMVIRRDDDVRDNGNETADFTNSTFILVNNEQGKLMKGESMPEISGRVKLFPYHILSTLNRRLPKGVDRTCLEKHLTVTEFERIFGMSRDAFWRLPKWKRMEMKKKVHLF